MEDALKTRHSCKQMKSPANPSGCMRVLPERRVGKLRQGEVSGLTETLQLVADLDASRTHRLMRRESPWVNGRGFNDLVFLYRFHQIVQK